MHAEIDALESSIAKLTEDIAELTQAIADLDAAMAKATTLRQEEKATNAATVKDAQEANSLFETLMGDEVEPRREFIQDNALKVANLDV